MALKFCSFASGSSGNCYLVKSEHTNILVDVGITGKRIMAVLSDCGIGPEDVGGIRVTHEHTDHVKSIRMMGRKAKNAEVYGTHGTLECVRDRVPENRTTVISGSSGSRLPFLVGDIKIQPFELSHDAAEPVGYTLCCGGKQITIVTDTGCITDEIYRQISSSDLVVLEANHEVNILKMGPYPYPLKRRILSDQGHLSNETAGETLCRILGDQRRGAGAAGSMNGSNLEDGISLSGVAPAEDGKIPKILLGHLSRENNTPQQAFLTVQNMLYEEGYYNHKDLELSVIRRDEESPLIEV